MVGNGVGYHASKDSPILATLVHHKGVSDFLYSTDIEDFLSLGKPFSKPRMVKDEIFAHLSWQISENIGTWSYLSCVKSQFMWRINSHWALNIISPL